MARFTGLGPQGETGPQGPQGETGPAGPTGADGADGSSDIADFEFTNNNEFISTISLPEGKSIVIDVDKNEETGDGGIVQLNLENDFNVYSQDNVNISASGGLTMTGLEGAYLSGSGSVPTSIVATDSEVIINGSSGEFLNNSSDAANQIATIGDVASYAPETVSFTVNGGTLGTQPTFDGAPLFTGRYIKIGDFVTAEINVEMTNITSFGTGQYFLDLPFTTKQDISFSGVLHDVSANNYYVMTGIAEAGGDRALLYYSGSNGQLEPFQQGSPKTLQTVDHFSLHGTYIDDAN